MLTVVIPTKNRSASLNRTLKYYQNINFPYKILILDSSSGIHRDAIKNIVKEYQKNQNFHFMEFNDDIAIYLKIKSGIDSVTTKYLIIVGDDDYLIPSTLKKGVAFLESNPDYSVVHGVAFLFYLETTTLSSKIKFIEPYYQRSIEQETATVRLNNHLSDYSTTFQSIHRSELIKSNLRVINIELLGSILDEMFLTSLDVIQGKIKSLPDLYMLRERSPIREHPPGPACYFKWILSESFRTPYEMIHSYLSELLSENEKIPLENASDIVDNAYSQWISPYLFDDYVINKIDQSNSWMKILQKFSIKTKTGFRLLFIKIRDIICRTRLSFKMPHIKNYYDDFKPINESITGFTLNDVSSQNKF